MTPPIEPQTFTQQGGSYSVRLADFGDHVLADKYAEVLKIVVDALARELPLHELDGFTLAVDYHAALRSVDRGDPNLPPVTSDAPSYAEGVVKPVAVLRNGTYKKHLVVSAHLGETWLSPDATVRATGLHTLITMLAGVAHATLYADAEATALNPGAMGREFYLAVAATPVNYWCARQAAFVAPDQGQTYANLVIVAIDFAKRQIANQRVGIQESGDISDAMQCALKGASAVLGHVADWLGHRDGLTEGQPFMGSDLPERLKEHGLDRWLELFGRDLMACYGPDGLLNLEIVSSLSTHVERLLWSLGVYCWPQDGDDLYCLVTGQFFVPPNLP